MKRAIFLLMLALPHAGAQGPVRAALSDVSVRVGAGREPLVAAPASSLGARLALNGLAPGAHPSFRCWKLDASALKDVERGLPLRSPRLKAVRLVCEAAPSEGAYLLQGPWKGGVGPEDRFLVEVWVGRRRVAWAAGPVQELLLPAGPAGRAAPDR